MAKAAISKNSKQQKAVPVQDAPVVTVQSAAPLEEKKGPALEEQITELQKGFITQTELSELLYSRQVRFEEMTLKRLKGHNDALRFALYGILLLSVVTLITVFDSGRPRRYIIH